uniref:MTTase N-terminal domain-containing protein n=1 Tax=Rhodosorus marinus TaxID=101924 RepID=A0A7S3A385_9RHOD|mmetsp:Transcript_39408/g.156486  ORF Transcript_39408/g.156486 Transcript_39408/m.156486 type:complete len:279 (+) Transcript_39408:210-1046(+)
MAFRKVFAANLPRCTSSLGWAGTWQRWMATSSERRIPNDGLEMKDFFPVGSGVGIRGPVAEVNPSERDLGRGATYHIETYGCQMNVADSELVRSILNDRGYREVPDRDTANILMVNTCSIRDKAERKVLTKLSSFRKQKLRLRKDRRPIVCVLGCMAERLKTRLLEEMLLADVVVGPDAYRDLPRLLSIVRDGDSGAKAYNVQLSLDETYADLRPVRTSGNGVSAFVSIMRGCANMCTYCIVPFTRGRERSRPLESIVDEITGLVEAGYKVRPKMENE